MRTIFSCMWPSCSVNCDSLEDIERHVRAHLGCKQYESIGDEDFYYEETEVDEPTYLAIFNRHPGSAVSASRHHAHQLRCPSSESASVKHHHNHHHLHHQPGAQSPSHNSDGLSSGQSFASSSPATSPVCSTDSSPPSSSSSLSYHTRHHQDQTSRVFSGCSSAANSIDWNQFLSSSSLVALEQQHELMTQQLSSGGMAAAITTGKPTGKRNNLSKWPSSASNYSQQQQQVYLMNGISSHLARAGSPFSVCDLATDPAKATAQPIICDASIFMQQQAGYNAGAGSQSQFKTGTAATKTARSLAGKRQQQFDNSSNLNHRNNNRTRLAGIKSDQRRQEEHEHEPEQDNNNQKNHNQISSSLQFSMQLTGAGGQARSPRPSPGYGTMGAIYQSNGQAHQRKQQRANSQRLANLSSNNRHQQSAFDHSYKTEDRYELFSQQLEGGTKTRRGRRPGAKQTTARYRQTIGRGQHQHHHDHHQQQQQHHQIFQPKHQKTSGKSLANKTITRTSAPSPKPTPHVNCNSPTTTGSAVPLIRTGADELEECGSSPRPNGGLSYRNRPAALEQHQRQRCHSSSGSCSPVPSLSASALEKPAGSQRRVRGENRKCRKVYGMERRDQWCTQCKWKKACTRFSGDGKLLLLANKNNS